MDRKKRTKISLFLVLCLVFNSIIGAVIVDDKDLIRPEITQNADSMEVAETKTPDVVAEYPSGKVKKGTRVSFTTTSSAMIYTVKQDAGNEESVLEEQLITDENLYKGPVLVSEPVKISVIAVDKEDQTVRSQIETYTYTVEASDGLTIEEVKKQIENKNSQMQMVQTSGIVTYVMGNQAVIQDETGGIELILDKDEKAPDIGDEVQVSGYTTLHNGLKALEQVKVKSVESTGNKLPEPEEITVADLKADFEKYESRRVKLMQLTAGKHRGAGVTAFEGNDGMIYVSHAPAYPEGMVEGSVTDIIGIASIYDQYHTKNYRLRVMDTEDYITSGTQMPVVEAVSADPSEGKVKEGQTITLSCPTEDVSFEYSIDNKDWTVASSGQFVIVKDTDTYYVRAKKSGYRTSSVTKLKYELETATQPAQEPVKIEEIIKCENSDEKLLKTKGIVTYAFGNEAVIQDETGAIELMLDQDVEAPKSGDQIVVTGYKNMHNGLNTLTKAKVILTLATGKTLPEPEEITIAELKADFAKYESRRIKLLQVTVGKNRGAGVTTARGDGGEIYINRAPEYPDGMVDGSTVDIIGIASVYDRYNTRNYHLRVASAEDYSSTGGVKSKVEPVSASPSEGEVKPGQEIQLSCPTQDVTFEYSTDQSDWTVASSGKFVIIKGVPVYYVRALKTGYRTSEITTLKYTLKAETQPSEAVSVSEILKQKDSDDQVLMTQGIVTYVFGQKVIIQDETAAIELAMEKDQQLLKAGEKVTVKGYKNTYNGLNRLKDTTIVSVDAADHKLPEPVVVTIAQLRENFANYESRRVKLVQVTAGKYRGAGSTQFKQNGESIYVSHAAEYPQGAGEGSVMDLTGIATRYENYGTTTCRLYIPDTSDYTVIQAVTKPNTSGSSSGSSSSRRNRTSQSAVTNPETKTPAQNTAEDKKIAVKDNRLVVDQKEADISADMIRQLLEKNDQARVLNIDLTGDSRLNLDQEALKVLSDQAGLKINVKDFSVEMKKKALKDLMSAGKKISIAVKDSDKGLFEIEISADGHKVQELPKGCLIILNQKAASNMIPVYTDQDGKEKIVVNAATVDGKLTFILNGNGSFRLKENKKNFKDIKEQYWAKEAVEFAASRELLRGTDEGKFNPDQKVSRGMFVTILNRLDDEKLPEKTVAFKDVRSGSWYAASVMWAVENKVATGTGENTFNPDKEITRIELISMLYNYAGKEEAVETDESVLNSYADLKQVPAYSKKALAWAVEKGIIKGNSQNQVMPGKMATRAEVSAMLERFIQKQLDEK